MKGHIRQRSKDTWAIVIYLGTEQGKKRQKWYTVHGSKKDAERELRRLLHEMDTGAFVEPSKLTVGEYLTQWLEYVKMQVSGPTYDRYEAIVRLHLTPRLGKIPLHKLSPLQIQKAYAQMMADGNHHKAGGVSPRTAATHHRVLHRALDQAVKWQLLSRNPAENVEPPRYQRREMRVLDEEGVRELLDAARESQVYLPILLAVTTGMRSGEILALRWEDIDLASGTATIRRTMAQGRGLYFKEPKTAKSRRLVRLPGITVEALKEAHRNQAQHKLLLGASYKQNDLVCCQPDGGPIWPSNLREGFHRVLGRIGKSMRFHDLRHTHATLLLRQGVNPKIVSERLGHSNIGLTLDTYSHVLPDMQEEVVRKLDETFTPKRHVK